MRAKGAGVDGARSKRRKSGRHRASSGSSVPQTIWGGDQSIGWSSPLIDGAVRIVQRADE
jgi:hypothetical protein